MAERSRGKSDGRKRWLMGNRNMPGECLPWICGQVSSGRGGKVPERNQDNRRRSIGMDRGENRFLGGSDPTLGGLGAAQRLRRRGSLPPKLSTKSLAPPPAESQDKRFAVLNNIRK